MKTQIYEWRQALKNITLKNCAITLLGSFILAFGLYNVHSISGVTEGGVLGATFCWSIGQESLRRLPEGL